MVKPGVPGAGLFPRLLRQEGNQAKPAGCERADGVNWPRSNQPRLAQNSSAS